MSQTRSIAFTKMNGLGNDFVVIDARRENARLGAAKCALAARDHAVTNGCDQLLISHPPRNTGDVFMQIFNADGSEVEACGNGAAPWPPISQDWAHPSLSSKHWAALCTPEPRHKVKQTYSPQS